MQLNVPMVVRSGLGKKGEMKDVPKNASTMLILIAIAKTCGNLNWDFELELNPVCRFKCFLFLNFDLGVEIQYL